MVTEILTVLVLYASPTEVNYVKHTDMQCIGVNASRLDSVAFSDYDLVILWGTCGIFDKDLSKIILPTRLIEERTGEEGFITEDILRLFIDFEEIKVVNACVTTEEPVRSRERVNEIRAVYSGAYCIDQESYYVVKKCGEIGVPVVVLRYPIDRCNRKMMPLGNFIFRPLQHYRNQRFLNKILEELY